jgi:hypothetical protein
VNPGQMSRLFSLSSVSSPLLDVMSFKDTRATRRSRFGVRCESYKGRIKYKICPLRVTPSHRLPHLRAHKVECSHIHVPLIHAEHCKQDSYISPIKDMAIAMPSLSFCGVYYMSLGCAGKQAFASTPSGPYDSSDISGPFDCMVRLVVRL